MTSVDPANPVVSAAFAFALNEAEFSEAVIFAAPRPAELTAEEESAAETISEEALTAAQTLLGCCRDALKARATGTLLEQLSKKKTQTSKLRDEWYFELPIRVNGTQTDAALECGLYLTADGKRYAFHAYLWTRKTHWPALQRVLQDKSALQIKGTSDRSHRVLERRLEEGESFATIASDIAKDVFPWVQALDEAIAKQK